MFCYRKAGDFKLQELCEAYLEEQNGRDIISDPDQWYIAQGHYLRAAAIFQKHERFDKTFKCLESIREFVKAGGMSSHAATRSL